jgi:hypothetical protein
MWSRESAKSMLEVGSMSLGSFDAAIGALDQKPTTKGILREVAPKPIQA